jgi:hypothetical protein
LSKKKKAKKGRLVLEPLPIEALIEAPIEVKAAPKP